MNIDLYLSLKSVIIHNISVPKIGLTPVLILKQLISIPPSSALGLKV